MKYVNDGDHGYNTLQDISHKIKIRACSGYGLKVKYFLNQVTYVS